MNRQYLCILAGFSLLAQLFTLAPINAQPLPITASCFAGPSRSGPFNSTNPITLTQGQDLFLNISTNHHDHTASAVYTANFVATIDTNFSFGPERIIYTKARQGGDGLSTGGGEEVILTTGNRPTAPGLNAQGRPLQEVRIRVTSDRTGASVLAECRFPFALLASPAFPDTDGDGLLDDWEQNGFDANMDGTIDVDLPMFGANLNHKDLFLELDWLPNFEPRRLSIQLAKDSFAQAPINAGGTNNPDGQAGITLHIDTGPLADPTASEDGAGANSCSDFLDNGGDGPADALDPDCIVGDNLGGGEAIFQPLPPPPGLCTTDNAGPFYPIKRQRFNPNRHAIFRYGIFGPGCDLDGDGRFDLGGQAELGGNDLIVLRTTGAGGALGGSLQEGVSLMHEFGHNLNLHHGGFEAHNCKPNYVSVMNYQNSGFGIRTGPGNGVQHPMFGWFVVDFSPPRFPNGRGRAPLADLIENNLDETLILDPTDAFNRLIYSFPTNPPTGTQWGLRENLLNQLVDWNSNGVLGDSGVATDIDRDANGNPQDCVGNRGISDANKPLMGYDDWTNISLPFRQFGDSADAPVNPPHAERDPTFDDAVALERQLNTTDVAVALSAAPDPVVAGSQLVYSLTVRNNGPNRTAQAQVSLVLPSPTTYVSDTGNCLQTPGGTLICALGEVLAGASRQFTVTVRVAADLLNATGGSQGISASAQLTNLAGSDPNPGNDAASTTAMVVAQADLAIDKSCTPSPVVPGEDVTCTLSVTNAGPSDARSVTITDDLADNFGVTVAPASGGGFACTSDGANVPEITCSKGIQPVGTGSSVTYTLRVLDDAPPETTFTNTASVDSATADPHPANNTDAAVIATPTCTIDRRSARSHRTIRGTPAADVICGSAYSDSIMGLGGDDVIFGGKGDDKISGGDGADRIFGGRGEDEIKADDGDDKVFGHKGDDVLHGGRGNDVLNGGVGDDDLEGNDGDDTLIGDGGDDDCDGGQGLDSAAACEKVRRVP